MKINRVSNILAGVALAAGMTTLSGCVTDNTGEKAKARAVKYLNGDELLRAEIAAKQQNAGDYHYTKVLDYWDSLVTESKAKEAYVNGQQLVQDSVNKIYHRKPKFKTELNYTVKYEGLIDSLKREFAKTVTAEEFIEKRNNAPKPYKGGSIIYAESSPCIVHYWNLITRNAKVKEAFQMGMADKRAELIPQNKTK